MKKSSIVIAKENPVFCRELGQFLQDSGMFEVLEPITDGRGAADKIRDICPDILLLDVVLPNVDGIGVLRELRLAERTPGTKVLVLSSFSGDNIINLMQSLGVAYVIHMPIAYSVILERILDFAISDVDLKAARRSEENQRLQLMQEEYISEYLKHMGMPANLTGYIQAKKAILSYMNNPGGYISLNSEVYEQVAKECNTTPKRVERNIRNAIEVAWYRGEIKWQHKLFGYTVQEEKGRPTNKEFIAMIADRVTMRIKYNRQSI